MSLNLDAKLVSELKSASQDALEGRVDVACAKFRAARKKMELDYKIQRTSDMYAVSYALACALTRATVVNCTDLREAEKVLMKVDVNMFPLALLGLAKVYIKLADWETAKSYLAQLKGTKHTISAVYWPGTNTVISESRKDDFARELHDLSQIAFNPPSPEHRCVGGKCKENGYDRSEVYCSEVNYDGYVLVECVEGCSLEFHPKCWQFLLAENSWDENKKGKLHFEVVGKPCQKASCRGTIALIRHYNAKDEEKKRSGSKTEIKKKKDWVDPLIPKEILRNLTKPEKLQRREALLKTSEAKANEKLKTVGSRSSANAMSKSMTSVLNCDVAESSVSAKAEVDKSNAEVLYVLEKSSDENDVETPKLKKKKAKKLAKIKSTRILDVDVKYKKTSDTATVSPVVPSYDSSNYKRLASVNFIPLTGSDQMKQFRIAILDSLFGELTKQVKNTSDASGIMLVNDPFFVKHYNNPILQDLMEYYGSITDIIKSDDRFLVISEETPQETFVMLKPQSSTAPDTYSVASLSEFGTTTTNRGSLNQITPDFDFNIRQHLDCVVDAVLVTLQVDPLDEEEARSLLKEQLAPVLFSFCKNLKKTNHLKHNEMPSVQCQSRFEHVSRLEVETAQLRQKLAEQSTKFQGLEEEYRSFYGSREDYDKRLKKSSSEVVHLSSQLTAKNNDLKSLTVNYNKLCEDNTRACAEVQQLNSIIEKLQSESNLIANEVRESKNGTEALLHDSQMLRESVKLLSQEKEKLNLRLDMERHLFKCHSAIVIAEHKERLTKEAVKWYLSACKNDQTIVQSLIKLHSENLAYKDKASKHMLKTKAIYEQRLQLVERCSLNPSNLTELSLPAFPEEPLPFDYQQLFRLASSVSVLASSNSPLKFTPRCSLSITDKRFSVYKDNRSRQPVVPETRNSHSPFTNSDLLAPHVASLFRNVACSENAQNFNAFLPTTVPSAFFCASSQPGAFQDVPDAFPKYSEQRGANAALSQIPVQCSGFFGLDTFKEDDSVPDISDDCCICLEKLFCGNAEIRSTDCGHRFHRKCFDEWTRLDRNATRSCPVCRRLALPDEEFPRLT